MEAEGNDIWPALVTVDESSQKKINRAEWCMMVQPRLEKMMSLKFVIVYPPQRSNMMWRSCLHPLRRRRRRRGRCHRSVVWRRPHRVPASPTPASLALESRHRTRVCWAKWVQTHQLIRRHTQNHTHTQTPDVHGCVFFTIEGDWGH